MASIIDKAIKVWNSPTQGGSTLDAKGRCVVGDVRAYDVTTLDNEEMGALGARAGGFFRGVEDHLRVIALSEPFSAEPAIDFVQDRLVNTKPQEGWRRTMLEAYRNFLERLVKSSDLRKGRYYLLTWPRPAMPPRAMLKAAGDSFGTQVDLVQQLPPIFNGGYVERYDYLEPNDSQQPYICIMTAYELVSTWDLTTLMQPLRFKFPVAMSIDIATLARTTANRKLDETYNRLRSQQKMLAGTGEMMVDANDALATVTEIKQETRHGEQIHMVRFALMIKAGSQQALRENMEYTRSYMSRYMKLRAEAGKQWAAASFFSTDPPYKLPSSVQTWPVLSSGVGLMMPFGLRSRTETRGVMFGIDRMTSNPVIVNGWPERGEGSRGYHMTALGQTGSGKTFSLNVLLHRECAIGTQVVFIEPAGHCRRLIESVGPGGSYNRLALGRSAINLIDIVFLGDEEDGTDNLSRQITHVARQLSELLSVGAVIGGAAHNRRVFTNDELGALNEALQTIYKGIWGQRHGLSANQMPRLEDLCGHLEMVPGGAALATEIRRLYVTGSYASTFNRPTNVDLSLSHKAVAFDVSTLDESFRPWTYAQIFAALNRHIRRFDRGYPLIVAVDEYKYMAKNLMVADEIQRLVKTTRTYQAAIWTADQNPSSYTMNEESKQIITNTPVVLIGKQERADIDTNLTLFPRLQSAHTSQMLSARPGEFVAILHGDYYSLKVEPSPLEYNFFAGS